MSKQARVAVLGTGVIGLSTALEARYRDLAVTVYYSGYLSTTCSAKAAASFKPHEVFYDDRAHQMLLSGWQAFARMQKDHPTSGVRLHTHWEAASAPKVHERYLEVMQNVEIFAAREAPGAYQHSWKYDTFFIDMSLYLPWLRAHLESLGVRFVRVESQRFATLADLADVPEDVAFNCTGLGARTLCQDNAVYAIKGQVVLVKPRPALDWSISADGFYMYPRRHDTVLGGTTEHHVYSEHNDEAVTQVLLRAHRRLLPDLTPEDVLGVAYGLRPYRKSGVRVEKETVGNTTVIHNYGHGGAGVTLSLGSAKMALDLLGAS